jgi:hypothetical protein
MNTGRRLRESDVTLRSEERRRDQRVS